MRTTLASLALLAAMAMPAVACSWSTGHDTMARSEPAVPMTTATVPTPVEVALVDAWLERLLA